ncbi:unnamed protein product, partial [Polarella glacialis]
LRPDNCCQWCRHRKQEKEAKAAIAPRRVHVKPAEASSVPAAGKTAGRPTPLSPTPQLVASAARPTPLNSAGRPTPPSSSSKVQASSTSANVAARQPPIPGAKAPLASPTLSTAASQLGRSAEPPPAQPSVDRGGREADLVEVTPKPDKLKAMLARTEEAMQMLQGMQAPTRVSAPAAQGQRPRPLLGQAPRGKP